MDFLITAYKDGWKRALKMKGCATPADFWYFWLAHALLQMVIVVALFIATAVAQILGEILTGLYVLFAIAALVPMFTLYVRRLHDIGRSGWWLLVSFVPFIGALVLLVWTAAPSEMTENKYR